MTKILPVESGDWPGFTRRAIPCPSGALSVRIGGSAEGPPILFAHSILTDGAIWARQAARLGEEGFRVVVADTRGHGASEAAPAPYSLDGLGADVVAVLDGLSIRRAHFVGVSLGAMTGLGLGIAHADRLLSLFICAARADAPAPFAAAWDDRIALALDDGTAALAAPTVDRWFGQGFASREPVLAERLTACITGTSTQGFVGCARAIQGLDYLGAVGRIRVPTALVIGTNDESLLAPMRDMAPVIHGATYAEIADGGHLPQVDQPERFDAVLTAHLAAVGR
ncbi:alpha/beta fold hydrolase [Methylobacterium gnaphalii]|uniref:3-oxoadipate enol-lactonase n=1 Tax=Methylobacterium gnaphalii TaxID=1010610 RepID=A0A512JRI3_9HYPH|nr:alpha/beta hydrolase [Methylobacterium gnaphalii]GEP12567.1 3-oxoadipate enol-lactonase [Methylobacterium gnaphalii]GJD69067.1 3-oxoadipate enol-lactonase 2 [Methylobacterium gnaphalii]GLS47184.1 3-oxoadipate enol-lactonase [Methylobacterium gnaphalii]